jgi:hypothetical protein
MGLADKSENWKAWVYALRNITLLLRRRRATVVVSHADACCGVQVANDFDLVGRCAYQTISVLFRSLQCCADLPENGFESTTWKPWPAGCGAIDRGMSTILRVKMKVFTSASE